MPQQSETEKIKVLVVDDHPVVRNGLRLIQELDEKIQVLGAAGSFQAALAEANRLKPDVVLMDVRLPDGDGIEACRRIKLQLPKTRVLFLTSYADNNLVLGAMEAGAEGYVLKESDAQRIVDAIHSIMHGGTVFDPVMSGQILRNPRQAELNNPLATLTEQERRILEEVAKGRTDKEVAAALGLSAKTSRNYLDRVFVKLDVHTRTEAALLYARFSPQRRFPS